MARGLRGLLTRGDGGFTLVEGVVALSLIAVVAAGVAAEVAASLRSTFHARATLHAAELLTEQVESARALFYADLAMSATDVTSGSDPRLSAAGTAAAIGLAAPQPVYATAGGAVAPHVQSGAATRRGGISYTVARYVTTVTDPATGTPCHCRRFTAFVSWSAGLSSHVRSTSTIIADVRRGATPTWSWSTPPPATTPLAATAGASVDAPTRLVNHGVTDSWALTATAPAGWVVRWFHDDNGNGIHDSAENTPLDAGSPGTGSSGPVLPDQLFAAVAVVTVPTGTAPGSYAVTLTATPGVALSPPQSLAWQVVV